MWVSWIELIISLSLLFGCFWMLRYLVRGALFVPTHEKTVKEIVRLAEITPGVIAADIGSGDGRIVIELAKAGAKVTGFEIVRVLAWWSNRRIKQLGLENTALIKRTDFWKEDFSRYDRVVVFGITHIMDRLSKKLKLELRPGTLIISNGFELPGFDLKQKQNGIFVYIR
jgi:protein-L-isoaspartate O-methyltransferase